MNVAIRNRRSPSRSGTSLSTAIANENGSTNAVSAHTAGGIVQRAAEGEAEVAVHAEVDRDRARTPEMHSDATTGKRLSRTGGSE